MIDHLTLTVPDLAAARAFFQAVLAPLGYRLSMDFAEMKLVGFGDARKPYFWVKEGPVPTTPQHLAFVANSRAAVDAFHAAAVAAGAVDDGAPGLRLDYHSSYYAAFVVDPNGHHLEAVNHGEAPAAPKKKVAARSKAKRATKPPVKKKAAAKSKGARRGRR